jgi:DNA repair protein RecN (Recombination protein N)
VLQEIRIQNLGVIDDAVLELHPGLNVITGETGAGKTMVVSGLGLLLGARADPGLVRGGSGAAVVEGILDIPADHPTALRAAEAGADVDSGLILLRTMSAEGRSRAHVGGRSAPIGLLAELGQELVAVHGQADQRRLRHADQHREVLDAFGGEPVALALTRYRAVFEEHERVLREVADLREASRERAREADALQLGLEQIEALDPQPGEDAELRLGDERLSHAEELRLAAEAAHLRLVGSDEGYAVESASVVDLISAGRSALAPVVDRDPALLELDRRLAEVGYLVADLATDLAAYRAGIELDPGRLAWVQQRRSDLSGLTRKYGDTVDDVLAWAREASGRLHLLLTADDRLAQLDARLGELKQELADAADVLSRARHEAASELAVRATSELAHLSMGKARVTVDVRPRGDGRANVAATYARHGADEVEILLAANPGSPVRSVARAASGGELSRVMLALEVVTAHSTGPVPTFVFDEVDAGVGGKAALDVGARLASLARHAQVLVVTHLAQVAAYADRHLTVHKSDDGHITSSGIAVVDGEARVRELARMMAGQESAVALEHARELLRQTSERSAAVSSAGQAR